MSNRPAVVVDTNVFGAALVRSPLAATYAPILTGRPLVVSFQTVAELRFGAVRRGWGATRMRLLEERLEVAAVMWADRPLVEVYVDVRDRCDRIGHALAQRHHDADRWIAATALRLGAPLVSHDGIFRGVPGLVLETALPT